ncbi:T20D4.11-like domain-containing protein [Caenorhabditis elegans]|uniref:T20D4.11-like domain-containing protein n=1 Tax=Caenorhabditis elegans TaxID=6239 RepID=Q966G4_CAEEL|nr:DUF19 domain-containing protein [Caenorhabditis elegans]CCD83341.1 DUF19 domain-containing protein [Caenorhabditis elegans]|eukprot:NP_001024081.1 Uncharacterized protein CELE_R13D7.2 [Caenorhabditis elegans]
MFTQLYSLGLFLVFIPNHVDSEPIRSQTNSLECSEKDLLIMEGKCSRYVNEYTLLSEEYNLEDVTADIAKNMSYVCDRITNCFDEIPCDEAQKFKRIYEQKCEKDEFRNYKMTNCVNKLYDSIYLNSNNCSKAYQYFSKDLRVRREAYSSGESCIVDIAEAVCVEETALTYLNTKYDQFVDIMSIKPDSEHCTSLHDELFSRQCEPMIMKREKDQVLEQMNGLFSILRSSKKTEEEKQQVKCEDITECMKDACYNSHDSINKFEQSCSDKDNDSFDKCYRKLLTSPESIMYNCPNANSTKNSTVSLLDMLRLNRFSDNKECTRTLMAKICTPEAMKTFDKDWGDHQRRMAERN